MSTHPVKIAIVTGGHPYEVIPFHQMFHALEGVEAYIQSMDEFATSPEAMRDSYDVVGFYHMLMDGPTDDGPEWLRGKVKSVLEHTAQTGQGMLILHHAILAYPQWAVWNELVGIGDRSFGYHPYETIQVTPASGAHRVTQGLAPWEMVDETYTMAEPDSASTVLLTVEHPKSMRALAWTRTPNGKRIFCFQSGHDHITWDNAGFRTVLQRGILWSGGRL